MQPAPIKAKPASATYGCGAADTAQMPMAERTSNIVATARAPNRSTSGSTNRRASAMQKIKSVNPSPPMKGSTENTSRI
ncbi:hypothetical protein ACVIDN_005865 [Rhizobium brockwellii]